MAPSSKLWRELTRPFHQLRRQAVGKRLPAEKPVVPTHRAPGEALQYPKSKVPLVEPPKPEKLPDVEYLAPTAPLEQILPKAADCEIRLFARHIRTHVWAMPEHELMVLGAIVSALQPRRMFEFGTYTGGSTLVMAANAPQDFSLTTIDIGPLEKYKVVYEPGQLYKTTRYAAQVRQIIGDSLEFRTSDELRGAFDLVFVDGNHRYQWAYNDTCLAFELVRPGGVVLWHDYTWYPQHAECIGVTQTVNQIQQERGRCHHIAGTRFAIYLP